ncbi:MAG: helix-turn-helix transcriptional regulator [Bacillus sp. (in: firmicutes)]
MAEHNPCGMSDDIMGFIAKAIKSLLDSFIAVDMSREQAANYLGVSTRTLGRLVEEGLIEQPKRRGFRNKAYSKKSLDEYLETRK